MKTIPLNNDLEIPQIVLRWIVQRGLITIPRAKPSHFAENLEIMTFSLSDDDMQAMRQLGLNMAFMIKSIHLGLQQFGSPKILEELTETHYIR